jgi:hypothetical protein
MTIPAERTLILQNVGLIDRLARLLLGAAIMVWAYYSFANTASASSAWLTYSYAIALYPIFTGMLGWDPVYALFRGRSCSDSGSHLCGSLPYQAKALFGVEPRYCDTDADRSLEACHDEPAAHPRHKVWRVDVDPVLYPDDRAWHRYFTRRDGKQ